jgi:hypothetical protein
MFNFGVIHFQRILVSALRRDAICAFSSSPLRRLSNCAWLQPIPLNCPFTNGSAFSSAREKRHRQQLAVVGAARFHFSF